MIKHHAYHPACLPACL